MPTIAIFLFEKNWGECIQFTILLSVSNIHMIHLITSITHSGLVKTQTLRGIINECDSTPKKVWFIQWVITTKEIIRPCAQPIQPTLNFLSLWLSKTHSQLYILTVWLYWLVYLHYGVNCVKWNQRMYQRRTLLTMSMCIHIDICFSWANLCDNLHFLVEISIEASKSKQYQLKLHFWMFLF